MNRNKRILVIDENHHIGDQLRESLTDLGFDEITVTSLSKVDLEILGEMDVLIIDSKKVKDIKEFGKLTRDFEIPQTILMVEVLFDNQFESAHLYGMEIYYRQSSIKTLVEKVLFDVKRQVEIIKEIQIEKSAEKQVSIAVYSPQGGSGKTTTVLSLAHIFAKNGQKTLVLEYSQVAAISAHLQLSPPQKSLSKVIDLSDELDQSPLAFKSAVEEEITRFERHGVEFDILFGASIVKMDLIDRLMTERIISAIQQMDYDVILIDTSSDVSERNLSLFDCCHQVVMISTPDISSAWKLIQVKQLIKSIGLAQKCVLIVNKFSNALGFSTAELESELQMPLVGTLGYDVGCQIALNQGRIHAVAMDGRRLAELEGIAEYLKQMRFSRPE